MNSDEPMNGGDGEQATPSRPRSSERFGTTLRSAAVWEDPPADLGDRIVVQVERPAGQATATVRATRRRRRRRHRRPSLDDGAPPTARSCAGCGRGWPWLPPPSSPSPPAPCSPAATTTSARASRRRRRTDADRPRRRRHRPTAASSTPAPATPSTSTSPASPPAPEGQYYEGWLHDTDSGDWVSVGTFHMRGGDGRVVLWSGVPHRSLPASWSSRQRSKGRPEAATATSSSKASSSAADHPVVLGGLRSTFGSGRPPV